MARRPSLDAMRKAFAEATATLEDAAPMAADGQAVADNDAARRHCEHLVAAVETCLGCLQRLRRRLG